MNLDLLEARAALELRANTTESLYATLLYLQRQRINLTGPAAIGNAAVLPVEFLFKRFDFAEEGRGVPAFVFEVYGRDAATVEDVAAFSLTDPTRVATMFGASAMLGETVAGNPATYFGSRPLRVFRSGLAWLQADGQGVVPIDAAACSAELPRARGFIAADDRAHARWLVEELAVPRDRLVIPSVLEAA